jgi:hypothetical protein
MLHQYRWIYGRFSQVERQGIRRGSFMFVRADHRERALFASILMALILAVGCDDGGDATSPSSDSALPDQMLTQDSMLASPPDVGDAGIAIDAQSGPLALPTTDDVPANPMVVAEHAFERWAVLRDGRIVGQTAQTASVYAGGALVAASEIAGDMIDAVLLDDTVLVLSTEGLFSLSDLGLERSPLNGSIGAIVRAAEGHGSQGWFAHADSLSHWSNGHLRQLMAVELAIPWDRAQLAAGRFRDTHTLWIGFDRTLLAVTAGESARSWRFDLDQDIQRIASTKQGLFVLFNDGLAQLNADETWTRWIRPPAATLIAGHPDADDLWISNGIELWQVTDGALRARRDAPVHTSLKVSADGSAFIKDATTVFQVVAGRFLTFTGLESGDRLTATTTIEIVVTTPDQVDHVSAQMDEEMPIELEGPPWAITLDPAQVGPGNHALTVLIRYDDGGELAETLEFVGPPTWTADIQPLSSEHCSACHGDGGSAHLMSSIEAWRDEIAAIIDDVETGRMPYGSPMLAPEQIELIRAWRDTGLLEQ